MDLLVTKRRLRWRPSWRQELAGDEGKQGEQFQRLQALVEFLGWQGKWVTA